MINKKEKNKEMRKGFDYYIFIDYSENLIGYNIIKKENLSVLLPKISKFRHYKDSQKRKIYLSHIKKTIQREGIRNYFEKIKIVNLRKNVDLFVDVLEFIKKHERCIIFISVDDFQYKTFMKLVHVVDGDKTRVIKESQLKRGSIEYKLSLVLDNLLNIERRKNA